MVVVVEVVGDGGRDTLSTPTAATALAPIHRRRRRNPCGQVVLVTEEVLNGTKV